MSVRIDDFLRVNWKNFCILLTPIVFLPIIFLNDYKPEFKCLYVVAIMAVYWITEFLPISVTGCIPILLFPLLDIMKPDKVTACYMRAQIVMFFAGIALALAVEHVNLHTRLALKMMTLIGCTQRRISVGLTFATMFLSMWMSNTAATSMMCPINLAVIKELEAQKLCVMYEPKTDPNDPNEAPRPSKITLCYFLLAAYASSLGGCATLIGSVPNMIFSSIYAINFPLAPELTFGQFMSYGTPVSLISTFLTWIWMQTFFMGMFRPNSEDAKKYEMTKESTEITARAIAARYKELGPMKSCEYWVAFSFGSAILLWIFRKPGFITGWPKLITDQIVLDATPAMMMVILLFILPMKWTWLDWFTGAEKPTTNSESILTWPYLYRNGAWSLIFLMGGGFALAAGGDVSGMSKMVGESLKVLKNLPTIVLMALVCLVCSSVTELMSNTSVANLLLPILAQLGTVVEVHPLYMMMPASACCSYCFHLPVGTPPNAIAAAAAHIPTYKMIIAGIGPTVITLVAHVALFPTLGLLIFPDLNTFPWWAQENATSSS